MKSDSGVSVSVWMKTAAFPKPKLLSQDEEVDVCIIGSGISGLSAAYLLSQEGKSVIILDDGPVAGGETCRTTAHLTTVFDTRFVEIESLHGIEGAKIAVESHVRAIDMIASWIKKEKIECDFKRVNAYLCFTNGESPDVLLDEQEAALRAGIEGVKQVSQSPIDHLSMGPALQFKKQAQFRPLKYLHGLLNVILKNGGRLFQAHVDRVDGGDPSTVLTSLGFKVTAKAVIVATNTPFNDWVVMHTKQAAYRTYVIGARVPSGSVPEALYYDTDHPYHYVRLQSIASEGFDLLIVGGEDHKTGQAEEDAHPYDRLEKWARDRFPMIEKIEYRWSGQVMNPVDGLAFIGRNPMDWPNVYIATGDAGQGMTHGTIAGILLTDLICGRENTWEKLYDPARKTLKAAWNYTRENANVAIQYADWMTKGSVDALDDIPLGCGAILRSGLNKTAVYHDTDGSFIKFSAVCPHLGGIVNWNDQEKTWDCPCHGSRFDKHGKVVNGPSVSNLNSYVN